MTGTTHRLRTTDQHAVMMIEMDEAGMMIVDPTVAKTTMRITTIQMEDSDQLLVNRIIQDHLMTEVSNKTGRTLPEDHP